MPSVIRYIEGGTVQYATEEKRLLLRENPEISLMARVFGGLGGVAFLSVAALFWSMDVSNADASTPWLRLILCAGLAGIAVILAKGSLSPRKSIEEVDLDANARELRVSKVTPDGTATLRHTVPFKDIKRFYAGSEGSAELHQTGSTVLYMEGEGGPRNGVLMAGSVIELELQARNLNELLNAPVSASGSNGEALGSSASRGQGFGRKGV